MTGPVERVPLTDDKLDELEKFARDNGNILALGFIAELRASRTREQELRIHCAGLEASLTERIREREARQQRIDKALAWCRKANPQPDLNGDLFGDLIAALTETTENPMVSALKSAAVDHQPRHRDYLEGYVPETGVTDA